MVNLGLVYKSLIEEDFKVLVTLERLLTSREHVSVRLLERMSGLHESKLMLILSKLHDLNLVKRNTISGEKMYRLTYLGYDMLALRGLARANVIEAIGDKIGVGKESEIYMGLAPNGAEVAIKFLRIGRTSFRQTARTRSWIIGRGTSWYLQSRIAAEREFRALQELEPLNVCTPKPIGYNRHVVVIEFINGVELFLRPPLSDPELVLLKVLETIRVAYQKVSIVHGDLSEYNIIIRKSDENPFIIDWPQYTYRHDPNANSLLKRDVNYIVRFFNKVYGVNLDPEEALKRVVDQKI